MATYTQANRPLSVKTPLPDDDLLLIGFRGGDSLSQLFRYRLDLIAENDKNIAFDAILGQPSTVTLRWGPDNSKKRFFNGICSRISQGERDPVFTHYRMELVPKAWLLSRKAQSRIFQRLSVPDILKKVLVGFDVSYKIQGKLEPRDFCVQYRETDFNFACRLMEEEGIFYFFKHVDGNHTMVVGNSADAYEDVPEQTAVPYEKKLGGPRDELRITNWEKSQELRSGKYTLWDHCFELPHKHLEADKTIQDSVSVGSVTHKLKVANNDKLEIYDFPGEYAQRFDGIDKGGGDQPAELEKIFQDNKRTVEIRMQQEAAESLEIDGQGNCRQFVSGHKFTFQRHFNANGEYVLGDVNHILTTSSSDYRSGDLQATYLNTFTCIPVALPFRPPRVTPKPIVQGTQTAVVVGPSGEEIFTDKYSRIKVQFHWDRQGKFDPDSSCWLRVATPWAGKQWGMIHIPRIGQEVVVHFLEGDPDQPIVIGSVYNADMMPPGELPGSKTASGVKTRSTLNGTGENASAIEIEDKKGSEGLYIHAEKNQFISVENDETHTVGQDRTKSVTRDETTTVGRNRTETVKNDETITIGNDRKEAVTGNEIIHIKKNRGLHIKDNDTISIGGHKEMTIEKYFLTSVGETYGISVEDELTISVGESSLKMNKNGTIELVGKDIKISGMNVDAGGKQEVKMGSGNSIISLKPEGATTSAPKIDSSAVGIHSISGAVIKLN